MSKFFSIKQLFEIAKMHFYVSFAAMFMSVIGLSIATGDISKYIFSGVFTFVYALTMYSKGEETARRDRKEYTKETPYSWKGIILPVGIFLVWGALYVLYHVTWKYGIITYNSGIINNLLFVMWNATFSGFLNLNAGSFDVLGIVMVFAVPVISCGLGYFAGYKNYDLSIRVAKLVYEKKNEEEAATENDKGQEG